MSATGGTVTIATEVWDKLRDDKRALDAKVTALEEALRGARVASGDPETLARYREAFLRAVPVVRFAVANLDPETIRGWPHRELAALAEEIIRIPGASNDDIELALAWRSFAGEAADVDRDRAAGTHKDRRLRRRESAKAATEGVVHDDAGNLAHRFGTSLAIPEGQISNPAERAKAVIDRAQRDGIRPVGSRVGRGKPVPRPKAKAKARRR